ncbi:hypothetical protein AVEN_253508-1 [Araneus ventricosus]|uniref:Uncharacterized protein n=1 Tax=Araneus ventricosus TaxID=182803 RepID=A0A4Y2BTX6_ARAVE|nr:hypothetical protein AVEN_253508-1 [Araneus ventricosus]
MEGDGDRRPLMTYLNVLSFHMKKILEIGTVIGAGGLSEGCGNSFVQHALSTLLMRSGELSTIKAQASSVISLALALLYVPVVDMLIQLSFTLLLLLSC